MNWYLKALKQYVRFGGRARRAEYWNFMLLKWLILLSIEIVIFGIVEVLGIPETVTQKIFMNPGGLYFLWTIPPSLAVTVRRLHDTNRSGLWIFLKLIDIFTVILRSFILFIFLVQDSQPGRNRFGRNPKEVWD